jgi:hypothetical protein
MSVQIYSNTQHEKLNGMPYFIVHGHFRCLHHLLYLPYTLGQELVFCSLVLPPDSLLFYRTVPKIKGHIGK